MSIQGWLEDHRDEYPSRDALIVACMAELGKGRSSVRKGYRLMKKGDRMAGTAQRSKGTTAISLKEMRAKYDYRGKLRECLKRECAEGFQEDGVIRAASDIPIAIYRHVADLAEFDPWRLKADGRLYWGKPADVETIKADRKQYHGV